MTGQIVKGNNSKRRGLVAVVSFRVAHKILYEIAVSDFQLEAR